VSHQLACAFNSTRQSN